MYCRKLTKEELLLAGVTKVTEDCKVFCGDKQLKIIKNNKGYFTVRIYELDAEGNRIKIVNEKYRSAYIYKCRTVGLHRLMWAWHFNEVPCGMVVDHINNKHENIEDYRLENLQLMTSKENINKEHPEWHTYEMHCMLDKPRSHYENKLEGYTMLYIQAKQEKNADLAHKMRTAISQTKARLRYYDSHIAEVNARKSAKEAAEQAKQERLARIAKKKELKYNLDNTRKHYKKVLEVYGKDDPYVQKMCGEWKLAIAMYNGFLKECKTK